MLFNHSTFRFCALFLAALFVAWCGVISAADDASNSPPPDGPTVVKLTLQPASPPKAVLKYPLLPPYLDQTEGNAAPLYYRALMRMKESDKADNQKKVSDWLEMPLKDMPRDEARKMVERYRSVLDETAAGARREYCQWDFPIRRTRDVFSILLEEIQESRALARLLALQARVQMLDGKFPEAVHTLQTGYALARHVGEMPFLISGLVGLAISHTMSERVQELVELPGSPNLYWTLTKLPQPFIDIAPSLELESSTIYLMFPFLRDAETAERTPAQWKAELDDMHERLVAAGAVEGNSNFSSNFMITAYAFKGFPLAKQHLLAKGYSAEKIEKMPVAQVIAIHTADTYDEIRDDLFKWAYLPYWQAAEGMQRSEINLRPAVTKEIIPLASLLLPAIRTARLSWARGDRRIVELRAIESLRMYAAANDGKLPIKLADIPSAPPPIDPITGKELDYYLQGETAVIEIRAPHGMSQKAYGKRYEITIAKKP